MIHFSKWFSGYAWDHYWETRCWSRLLTGIPAVLYLVTGVAALLVIRRPESGVLAAQYRATATRAREDSNREREDLCLRRLLALQPTDPQTRYDYALLLALKDQGEVARASRIMQTLAPLKKPDGQSSYAPAHFWVAQQMMNAVAKLRPGDLEVLERHLEASLVGRDAQSAARLPLAELALRTRRWSDAVRHLKEVVNSRPDLLLTLAAAYRELGTDSTANLIADRAVTYYLGLASQDRDDDISRLKWAESLVFQKRLPQALEVLQAGYSRNGDARYGTAIAQVFLLAMAGSGARSTPVDPEAPADATLPTNQPASNLELASRISLLEQALHFAPNHPGVLTAIAQLSTQETPDADQARVWLKDALARGDAPATVHLILGTSAAAKGDHALASLHLEQAHRLDPRLSVATNNLAYVLAHADPPQTERALQLIEAALQAIPNHPEYHETRGQILLQLGRPKDAIQDLELALKAIPVTRRGGVHDGLARAYEALGDRDLAQRHRKLADEIKSPPAPVSPGR